MLNRPFYFNKPASRVVNFTMSQFSLHSFPTDEWVITVANSNHSGTCGQSYLLTKDESLGDPRCEDFIAKIQNLAKKIESDFSANEKRRVFPEVCNLHVPDFKNGDVFSSYFIGVNPYK